MRDGAAIDAEDEDERDLSSMLYPVPNLVESQDSEEEEEEDNYQWGCTDKEGEEEVIVFENLTTGSKSWESWGEGTYNSYYNDEGSNQTTADDNEATETFGRIDRHRKVTMVQSRKDKSGEFVRERKTLGWCLDQGCEEVIPGVWAKSWYFNYLYGEEDGRKVWMDLRNRRLVEERGGRAIELDAAVMDQAIAYKEKAKRDFHRGQYNSAMESYNRAYDVMGGQVMGIYLVAHQRMELVNVLSNQSECCLRLNEYDKAIVHASAALQIEGKHSKSMLRRAKGIVLGKRNNQKFAAEQPLMTAMVVKDLVSIIDKCEEGEGWAEAMRLLEDLNPERS